MYKSIVVGAYGFLKNYAYADNLNIFLRSRVADFECNGFDKKIIKIEEALLGGGTVCDEFFSQYMDDINFRLIPKSVGASDVVGNDEKSCGLYLSNIKSSASYYAEKVNYFIDAPIELCLIETLWTLVVGVLLDRRLSRDCYGNRLHEKALSFFDKIEFEKKVNGPEIFKRYIDQYSCWRDGALESALHVAKKENNDVALLSLDIKSFFYGVRVDFDEIEMVIRDSYLDSEKIDLAIRLNKILQEIFSRYADVLSDYYSLSHPDDGVFQGVPIGFSSSAILANWSLVGFDENVVDSGRPTYYGRYVDDVLLVFRRPKIDRKSPIPSFIDRYLSSVLVRLHDERSYKLVDVGSDLFVQNSKLVLQFFDKNHGMASLDIFRQEIDDRSSAFRFLPDEHINSELDRCAYDILYDGSVNKIRSVVGVVENESELSRFISAHIVAHRLSRIDKADEVLPQIKVFFNGVNSLRFSRLWEKVYQYAIVIDRHDFMIYFFKSINIEINKLNFQTKNESIDADGAVFAHRLRGDLLLYNELSFSICLGLLSIEDYGKYSPVELAGLDFESILNLPMDLWPNPLGMGLVQYFACQRNINGHAINFRKSNLIRHGLVSWPLANYTDFLGNLTNDDYLNEFSGGFSRAKIDRSPRFIHFDEWQAFSLQRCVSSEGSYSKWLKDSIREYKRIFDWDGFPLSYSECPGSNNDAPKKFTLEINESVALESVRVALANIRVSEVDIESALRIDRAPNISFSRQSKIFNILNDALREGVDFLVFPEVSIPVSWLPFMVAYARRHQVAIVFGLEHWVAGGCAYNLIIEAIPFKVGDAYNSCVMTARLKNHYAPSETGILNSLRLKLPDRNKNPFLYHKVSWRGLCFATYNCFELSDIKHRAIFRSEIDMLVACVWNKDTNYYGHILESAVRDIHCYVVQSNTSQYGGSCILRPSKTESKTVLYVKGGVNSSILAEDIGVRELREFQFKSVPGAKDIFKHIPPGYNSESVLKR